MPTINKITNCVLQQKQQKVKLLTTINFISPPITVTIDPSGEQGLVAPSLDHGCSTGNSTSG